MQPERKPQTYEDLLSINDSSRYELINGELYLLASPLTPHSTINDNLFAALHQFFRGKTCRAYHAPADVFLNNQPDDPPNQISNVFQPDIFVICDRSQKTKKGYFGPPSLIAEILSPSTAGTDKIIKFNKYQTAGVQEYWIADPEKKMIQIFSLREGSYFPADAYREKDQLHSVLFPDLTIDLQEIFQDW